MQWDQRPLSFLWLLVVLLALLVVQQSYSLDEQELLRRLDSYETALSESLLSLKKADMSLQQQESLIDAFKLELASLKRQNRGLLESSVTSQNRLARAEALLAKLESESSGSSTTLDDIEESYERVRRSRNFWRGATGVGAIILLILLL